MKNTGVFASRHEMEQARTFTELVEKRPGEMTKLFMAHSLRPFEVDMKGSPEDTDAAILSGFTHLLALAHGLPDIEGSYGISLQGEFQAPDEEGM